MCVSHVVVKYKKFFSTKILANFLYLYIYVIRCQISLNPPPSKCQKWSKPISHVAKSEESPSEEEEFLEFTCPKWNKGWCRRWQQGSIRHYRGRPT